MIIGITGSAETEEVEQVLCRLQNQKKTATIQYPIKSDSNTITFSTKQLQYGIDLKFDLLIGYPIIVSTASSSTPIVATFTQMSLIYANNLYNYIYVSKKPNEGSYLGVFIN